MRATAHKDMKTQIEYSDVKLIGHLAADFELRETKAGEQMLNMAIAISHTALIIQGIEKHSTKDADGLDVSTVNFFRVETRSKKVIEWVKRDNLEKGDYVLVWGSLENRSYKKADGTMAFLTFINANHINKIS